MGIAIISFKKDNLRTHADFMVGTIVRSVIVGGFATMPEKYISEMIGYGWARRAPLIF